jgi:phage pi2 protein 07
MKILLVEIDTDEILVDEDRFPNLHKESFIYEHLRYYFSKSHALPTIEIKLCDDKVFVTYGHYYLLIARDLQFRRIRAIINRNSSSNSITKLLQQPSIAQLDWEKVNREESDEFLAYIWVVIFFEEPLISEQKALFEGQVVNFFKKIKLPPEAEEPKSRIKNLDYTFNDKCAEFQAYVPIEDERWYAQSINVLENFHFDQAAITSFQGRRFNHN